MWIFTKLGFFSVVQDQEVVRRLVVRGRVREQLVALRKDIMSDEAADWASLVIDSPDADYPFRLYVDRGAFAQWLADHVDYDLDYTNFKGAVDSIAWDKKTEPTARYASALHCVWAVVRDALDPRPLGLPVTFADRQKADEKKRLRAKTLSSSKPTRRT